MRHRATLAALLFGSALFAAPAEFLPLPAEKIAALKKKPCTLLHVWAKWCTPCMQELPDLLRTLAATPAVHPVVIDVSPAEDQEGFSRSFLTAIGTSFTTYRRPPGNEDRYLAAIDRAWSGALPFSVLYHRGRERKRWQGSIPLDRFAEEVALHCANASKRLK